MILFGEQTIDEVLNKIHVSIERKIESERENYILNVSQTEYTEFLYQEFALDVPELHFDEVSIDSYEKDIPAERFPFNYHVYPGKFYKKDVIRFHIPFSGDKDILGCRPSRYTLSGGYEVNISGNSIVFEYINFDNDHEKIKREYDQTINKIVSNHNSLRNDCQTFNDNLPHKINSLFTQRKQRFLSKNNLLSQIGIPIKKKEGVPKTFSVPKVQNREKIRIKPEVFESGFQPEPTLDNNTYNQILSIINDVGKNFEKYPSTYADKDEESLRDHILLILQPNFNGASATGESFNKSGKTDILIRHESSNVFIAECKFWKGSKSHLSTIDQLLRYSTWRDTKSCIILFVKNKKITSVLDSIKTSTEQHSNFLSAEGEQDINWFKYRFHLNGDRNRELHISVLVFHIPPVD
jgi:hypothetical protein